MIISCKLRISEWSVRHAVLRRDVRLSACQINMLADIDEVQISPATMPEVLLAVKPTDIAFGTKMSMVNITITLMMRYYGPLVIPLYH